MVKKKTECKKKISRAQRFKFAEKNLPLTSCACGYGDSEALAATSRPTVTNACDQEIVVTALSLPLSSPCRNDNTYTRVKKHDYQREPVSCFSRPDISSKDTVISYRQEEFLQIANFT